MMLNQKQHILYRFFKRKNRIDSPTPFFYGGLGPKMMTPLPVHKKGDDS